MPIRTTQCRLVTSKSDRDQAIYFVAKTLSGLEAPRTTCEMVERCQLFACDAGAFAQKLRHYMFSNMFIRGVPMSAFRILMRNKLPLTLFVGFVGFLLAPLYFNRGELPPGRPQNKCTKHLTDPINDPRNIPRPDDSIKIIRLTNSGEFADRCDFTNALYELNWDRSRPEGSFGAKVKPGAQHLPKLVILYIHGWKHNANEDDSDRKEFEQLVKALRAKQQDNKRVVGIYIGWNAEADLWGWLENITFWVKENNADRIAQSSSVTEIISAVEATIRADPEQRDKFIAIGHSFGARILFSAAAQPLVSAVEEAHAGYPGGKYKIVRGIADAIILLNPAFQSSKYSAINGLIRNEERFSEKQPPLMVAISSDGDWATKAAFPIGQWLGLARSKRELHTLGNYDPFITHSLKPNDQEHCISTTEHGLTESFAAADLCLRRLEQTVSDDIDKDTTIVQPHNPFIVARTTTDVIKDHNDIWNDTFRRWLIELIAALENHHPNALDAR